MAERRGADEAPLAPRRPLSGPRDPADDEPARQPIGARVSAAVAAAGTAVSSAASRSSVDGSRSSDGHSRASAAGATTAGPSTARPRPKGTRRARLRLVHLDPWSVMKTSFLLAIALGIVTVVAVFVVWSVLDAAGVWTSINKTVADVVGGDSAQSFNVEDYVGTSRVIGFTMIVAVINVVLITAISTLGAFLYNLAAALLGGIEVTLAEDDR